MTSWFLVPVLPGAEFETGGRKRGQHFLKQAYFCKRAGGNSLIIHSYHSSCTDPGVSPDLCQLYIIPLGQTSPFHVKKKPTEEDSPKISSHTISHWKTPYFFTLSGICMREKMLCDFLCSLLSEYSVPLWNTWAKVILTFEGPFI